MEITLRLLLMVLCLPYHLSFASMGLDGQRNNDLNECASLLSTSITPEKLNSLLDSFSLTDQKPLETENADPLWFLAHNPDYSKRPTNQIQIKAITLDTEFGVGDNVFYPFGGIDVVTAANSPSVQAIYSAQLESFGDIVQGLRMLSKASRRKQIARFGEEFFSSIAMGWISSGTLRDASALTHGLGLHALLVIRNLMGAKILDVGYLSFQDGTWAERTLRDPPEKLDHGFVRFKYEGRIITYFLLRADLSDASTKVGSVGPDQLSILLKDKKFDSILRHIHGAQNRLKSDFSHLLRVLNQSDRIFTTGPEEEPYSSFPLHEVVWNQPNRVSTWAPYFGVYGPMAVLLKQTTQR